MAAKLPYVVVAAPGRGTRCLRCLRDGCGKHRTMHECRGGGGEFNSGYAGVSRRHRWVVDVVEAEPGYRVVLGVSRAAALAWRKRLDSLPVPARRLAEAVAAARGEAVSRALEEAWRRGTGSAVVSYRCRGAGERLDPDRVLLGLAALAAELLG